jgi:SAM-dependent methyltransferase
MEHENLIDKAAERGVPSLVWRAGQDRRMAMILDAAEGRQKGRVLVDGSGVGTYLSRLEALGGDVSGVEIERQRCLVARQHASQVVQGAAEHLPFPAGHFDLVISNEVLEHVQDDRRTIQEIVRTLKPGGRLVLFCPNRGYPFETHGIYWRGRYKFGNIPLVNYLPRALRDRLAPHVRVYTRRGLMRLFEGLPVRFITRTVIFGGYDNIVARFPRAGKLLRGFLHGLERTPLRVLGLSHLWVVEKEG